MERKLFPSLCVCVCQMPNAVALSPSGLENCTGLKAQIWQILLLPPAVPPQKSAHRWECLSHCLASSRWVFVKERSLNNWPLCGTEQSVEATDGGNRWLRHLAEKSGERGPAWAGDTRRGMPTHCPVNMSSSRSSKNVLRKERYSPTHWFFSHANEIIASEDSFPTISSSLALRLHFLLWFLSCAVKGSLFACCGWKQFRHIQTCCILMMGSLSAWLAHVDLHQLSHICSQDLIVLYFLFVYLFFKFIFIEV